MGDTTEAAVAMTALPSALRIPSDVELLTHGTLARNQKQRRHPAFFVNEVGAHCLPA
jgi:hypothetical protein